MWKRHPRTILQNNDHGARNGRQYKASTTPSEEETRIQPTASTETQEKTNIQTKKKTGWRTDAKTRKKRPHTEPDRQEENNKWTPITDETKGKSEIKQTQRPKK